LYGQGKSRKKEVKVHLEFAKKDAMQLMGLGIWEEEKVGRSLHGVSICKRQMSVIIVKSYNDE
jgi:hypothetical protein